MSVAGRLRDNVSEPSRPVAHLRDTIEIGILRPQGRAVGSGGGEQETIAAAAPA
jgi:hypothetical protein